MNFAMAYYSVACVGLVMLITHEAISPVRGQCTVQGCDNNDPLISIVAEIQQLRVDLFDELNKQVQGIHALLNASFQDMKSDHTTNNMSFQAVDRCLQEQGQNIHELLNASFEEMKSQLGTLNISSKAVDRCPLEKDICSKQFQSMHEVFNESFQEIKSQHDAMLASLQAVDRRLEEHDISNKNQTRDSQTFANVTCDPASDVCDCSDIKARGHTRSGVYEVCVRHQLNRTCTFAFCDMETANRASLVFQRRKDGSVNFNRTWTEYRNGFGNLNGEFWLGNEMLHLLTSKRNYKLRVDLEDFGGNRSYAEYARFSISSSADNYTLTIGNYSGTAGDSLYIYYNNRYQFSTYDAKYDDAGGSKHCARQYGGGWWYTNCAYANLNGLYHYQKGTGDVEMGFQWYHWRSTWQYPLKGSQLKLLPVA